MGYVLRVASSMYAKIIEDQAPFARSALTVTGVWRAMARGLLNCGFGRLGGRFRRIRLSRFVWGNFGGLFFRRFYFLNCER